MGFLGGAGDKEPSCQFRRRKRHGFDPWVRKIPWRGAWQPTPAFLPGESHGQRSLAGYSPWGRKNRTWLKQLSTLLTQKQWCWALDGCRGWQINNQLCWQSHHWLIMGLFWFLMAVGCLRLEMWEACTLLEKADFRWINKKITRNFFTWTPLYYLSNGINASI